MNQLNRITEATPLPTSPLHNQATNDTQLISTTPLKTNDESIVNKSIDLLIDSLTNDQESIRIKSKQNDRLNGDTNDLLSDLVCSTSFSPNNDMDKLDDNILDVTENKTSANLSSTLTSSHEIAEDKNVCDNEKAPVGSKKEHLIKPLGELNVTLESIKPSKY